MAAKVFKAVLEGCYHVQVSTVLLGGCQGVWNGCYGDLGSFLENYSVNRTYNMCASVCNYILLTLTGLISVR